MDYETLDYEYLDLPFKLSNGIFNIGALLFFVFLFAYVVEIISGIIERNRYKENSNYGSKTKLVLNPFKYILSLFKDDNNYSNDKKDKLILTGLMIWAFIGLFVWIGYFGARFNLFGSTDIGHYFEKYSYEEEYYVYLYPINQGDNDEEVKGRATILKVDEDYFIDSAYHSDGYVLDFMNDFVELDEPYICEDQFGYSWDVTLTSEKVE